ncbi:MAG TPA: hypothetical protein VGO94_00405 [Mycobacteriales bacterium]|nr:hypothetical protein [Mycobacteriales bacterium]
MGVLAGSPGSRVGEHRWPAALAILSAIALYLLLPNRLILGPRYVVPVLELLLLATLIAANPHRFTRETRELRLVSLAVVLLIGLTNTVALALLVDALLAGTQQGAQLLVTALQVWLTNLIGFGLAFWELDRGGPVQRGLATRETLPAADFRFPQDEDHDTVPEVAARSSKVTDWRPTLSDYLYVSLTNSTAYSPTDTMPLTARAKVLMGIQGLESFLLTILVIARAVNLLH